MRDAVLAPNFNPLSVRARKGIFMYFILFGPYAYQKVYSKKNRLKYENEDHHPNMEQKVNTPPI